MAKIKICGLRRKEDVEYVNEYKPDYVGFVFAKSKRQVNDLEAATLKAMLCKEIKAVGVFVNANIEYVEKLVNNNVLDMVQLHGDEDKKYIFELKSKVSCPIMKAVRVKAQSDISNALSIGADYLLLDTYSPDAYGGTGITFDISLIPKEISNYFLAGGINKENVLSFINIANPYCIDISSSVETDGFKDKEKIREIIDIIRNDRSKE